MRRWKNRVPGLGGCFPLRWRCLWSEVPSGFSKNGARPEEQRRRHTNKTRSLLMSSKKKAVCWICGLVTLLLTAVAIRAAQGSHLWRLYILQDPILEVLSELD